MDLERSDEQEALAATVRRVLAEGRDLAGVGAAGVLVPEAAGGAGLGMVEAAIVAEELGRALHPGPWLASSVGAARLLAATGGEGAGAGELLAGIAGGTLTVAAVLDGSGRVLGAAQAGLLLAIDGGTVVAVEDFDVEPVPSIDETVAFGVVRRLGPARAVRTVQAAAVEAVRDELAIAAAADALGAAQATFELAVEHAKVRHQFGRPVGSFQAVQHLCVRMFETVELFRGGVLHAAWAADAEPAERGLATRRLLAFADRLATVGDGAIQVLGGIGCTWEHDAHRYLKRLLTWSSAFGAPAGFRAQIGRQLG